MNNLNINPLHARELGFSRLMRIQQLPTIKSCEVDEEQSPNLLEYIKSNYKKIDPRAPDYRKTDFTLIFKTEINNDTVLSKLTKDESQSFALRIHNTFPDTIPDSKYIRMWTLYEKDDTSSYCINFSEPLAKSIQEIDYYYQTLNQKVDELLNPCSAWFVGMPPT